MKQAIESEQEFNMRLKRKIQTTQQQKGKRFPCSRILFCSV